MDDEAAYQQFLNICRSIAEVVALNLSLERHFNDVVAKVSQATWDEAFKRSPTWFDFYFLPPQEAMQRVMQLPSATELMTSLKPDASLLDGFFQSVGQVKEISREVAGIANEVRERVDPIELDLDDPEVRESLAETAYYKALCAEIRARCFFGQGMHALIAGGLAGNDVGFLRAVETDPTVQWHPALVERVSREAMKGRTEFAAQLRKAAENGPSAKIDKDLHQLRYVLGLLHELGILDKLTDADRYELFCHELGLYADTGKNPKAGLCTAIKRWQAGLVC